MATLVVTEGPGAGTSYPVGRPVILGREKGVDLQVVDIAASREHAKVYTQDGDWYVIDLGSRNGTKVNGSKVSRWLLGHGDVITIGKTCIRFDAPEVAARAPAPAPASGAAPAPAAAAVAAAAAPRGPSALERERERLRQASEGKKDRGARPAADDGSGIVIREKVLQYGRVEDKGGLMKEDLAQRGGLFKIALVLGLLGLGTLIVFAIVKGLEKDVVESPDAPPDQPAGK